MTMKNRILLSVAWFVLCVVLGSVGFAVMVNSAPRRQRTERASMLGVGAGALVGVGWAGLWLPYAAAIGKQRREERARAKRKRRKRK